MGSLLLFIALVISHAAEGAEEMYRVITFSTDIKEALKGNEHWKACGDYFASAESADGKIIQFTIEKVMFGRRARVFAFSKIDQVIVSVNDQLTAPIVVILENRPGIRFVLWMNRADFKEGLPCLANGKMV